MNRLEKDLSDGMRTIFFPMGGKIRYKCQRLRKCPGEFDF